MKELKIGDRIVRKDVYLEISDYPFGKLVVTVAEVDTRDTTAIKVNNCPDWFYSDYFDAAPDAVTLSDEEYAIVPASNSVVLSDREHDLILAIRNGKMPMPAIPPAKTKIIKEFSAWTRADDCENINDLMINQGVYFKTPCKVTVEFEV